MTTALSEFLAGIKAELPILVGALPFGLIYGVAAVQAGVAPVLAQAMSALVFAGSAQFIVAQLIGSGTPAAILILTGLIVNLRHALYSVSLAPHLVALPLRWKALLAYLLTDEAYAVTITHYDQPAGPGSPAATQKHWYFLGAGLALWLPWQLSTAVGIFLSAEVPAAWSLDITLPLTFIALVVPNLKDRASIAAAASAGLAAVLARNLPLKLGLVTATLIGIGVGLAIELVLAAHQARRQPPAHTGEDGTMQ